MAELTTAWMLGCVCGFFLGATVAGRRRQTYHELMSGGNLGAQPLIFNDCRNMRGNGIGGPTKPKPDIIQKPQFPAPRKITDNFL